MVAQFASNSANAPLNSLQLRLLEGLTLLPEDISLCLIDGKKVPLAHKWQENPLTKTQVADAIANGITVKDAKGEEYHLKASKIKGYGIVTGTLLTVSGKRYYVMALDLDGFSAAQKAKELSGDNKRPETVAFTSGREGRGQCLFLIPEVYAPNLQTKKIITQPKTETHELEQLEFRWTGLQSVLPPSVHPSTGEYTYPKGRAFGEIEIAIAPDWVIEQMLTNKAPTPTPSVASTPKPVQTTQPNPKTQWSDRNWALSFLEALSPSRSDSYDDWLKVGMALHSIGDDSLLYDWDAWSRNSTKYKPGVCDKKWASFGKRRGIKLGTLGQMAKEDGWQSPFEKPTERNYTGGIGSGSGGDDGDNNDNGPEGKGSSEGAVGLAQREKTLTMSTAQTDPKERLRLDVKALLKESDAISYEIARADIQSRYRLNHKAMERIIRSVSQLSQEAEVVAMGLDELFDRPTENIEYVIPGMLPVGEAALLIANPKTGKSLVAYDAAFAVATGEDTFLGEQCKQGKVLIVQCDESEGTAKGRLRKRGFRHEDAPNVRFMHKFSITQLGALETELETFRPTLVIIDSLRRINAGREISENSAEFADNIYALKELCSQYNAALILIHHSNKNNDAVGVEKVRGSSAIAGATWGVWELSQIPIPDPNNKKKLIIDPKDPTRIFSVIARDVEGQRLSIELDPENNHWVNRGEPGVSEEDVRDQKTHSTKVIELLRSVAPVGLEASEINSQLALGRGIYSVLNRLLGQKIIGSRPSTKDRRRTVYFCSTGTSGDQATPNLQEGNPPPPTLIDQLVIEYPETTKPWGVQRSITVDRNSIAFDHTPLVSEGVKQPSNVDTVTDTEYSITSPHYGGGRGVKNLDAIDFSGDASPSTGTTPANPTIATRELADKLDHADTWAQIQELCVGVSDKDFEDALELLEDKGERIRRLETDALAQAASLEETEDYSEDYSDTPASPEEIRACLDDWMQCQSVADYNAHSKRYRLFVRHAATLVWAREEKEHIEALANMCIEEMFPCAEAQTQTPPLDPDLKVDPIQVPDWETTRGKAVFGGFQVGDRVQADDGRFGFICDPEHDSTPCVLDKNDEPIWFLDMVPVWFDVYVIGQPVAWLTPNLLRRVGG